MPELRQAGDRLTYGEVVEWSSMLLDALDSANKDKAAIRQADTARGEVNHVKG